MRSNLHLKQVSPHYHDDNGGFFVPAGDYPNLGSGEQNAENALDPAGLPLYNWRRPGVKFWW